MSKQSEAKEMQGYTTQVRNCGNCANLTFEMKPPRWMVEHNERCEKDPRSGRPYNLEINKNETNLRCGVGGFAIKKTATCALHLRKEAA